MGSTRFGVLPQTPKFYNYHRVFLIHFGAHFIWMGTYIYSLAFLHIPVTKINCVYLKSND